MNFNNFTIKAQEVVQKAVQLTRDSGNQAIEPEHLLKAIMTEGDAVLRFIFQKLDINPANVERPLQSALQQLPRVSGGEPYLSNDASKVLEKASDIASKGGDQYVTVEALLMALFEVKSRVSTILKDAGMTRDDLQAAIIFPLVELTIKGPGHDTIEAAHGVERFLVPQEYKRYAPYLKPTLSYRFKGLKIIPVK